MQWNFPCCSDHCEQWSKSHGLDAIYNDNQGHDVDEDDDDDDNHGDDDGDDDGNDDGNDDGDDVNHGDDDE